MTELKSNIIRKKIGQVCDFFESTINEKDLLYDEGMNRDSALDKIQEIRSKIEESRNFTISFVGEYNSGKTTIINLLTGNDFPTDADVATQKPQKVDWNGITVIDTPGLGSGIDEHDQLTEEWLAKSDILIYVLTPDLFTGSSGERFLSMLDKYKRDHELMLVVNQIDREENEIEVYNEQLQTFIDPRHLDLYYPSFISAKYYELSKNSEYDDDEREFLKNKSNFEYFISEMNHFVLDRKEKSSLTTPLTQLHALSRKIRFKNKFDQEETLLNQKIAFCDQVLNDIKITIGDYTDRVKDSVRGTTGRINSILDYPPQDYEDLIKQEFEEFSVQLQSSIKILSDTFMSIVETFNDKNIKIDQSELAQAVESRIEHSEILKKIFSINFEKTESKNGFDWQQVNFILVDEMDKSEIKGLNNIFGDIINSRNPLSAMASVAGKVNRGLVKKVGKAVKFKFKPWQATRIAKYFSKAVPILNIASVAWETGSAVTDHLKKEKAAKQLRKIKTDMKSQLEEVSDEKYKSIKKVTEPMSNTIRFLKDEYKDKKNLLSQYSEENESILIEFEENQQICLNLYDEIYGK